MTTNSTYYFVSACAGSGKTASALKAMKLGVERAGSKYVLAQPTIHLIEETAKRAAYMGMKVRTIHSQNSETARGDFISAVHKGTDDILIITHNTLLSCWNIASKKHWSLIVDEVLPVDASLVKNTSYTYDDITKHLMLSTNLTNDSVLDAVARPESRELLETWAYNAHEDDNIKVMQPFWQMVSNEQYTTTINRNKHQSRGLNGKTQIIAHGFLKPDVLDGWNRVTIMAANFKNSLMYLLWSHQGIDFQVDPYISIAAPAHTRATGQRVTVYYFTENDWTKGRRNRFGFGKITKALADHPEGPKGDHIWAANNDVRDIEYKLRNGERIPVRAEGMNDYRDHTTSVFLAALNDNNAHFKWAQKQFGVEPMELSIAKSMETAYQNVMRTNLRVAEGTGPVGIYVADRRTANYLNDLFPSSKQKFIDLGIKGLGESARGANTYRPAQSSTERSAKHREAKKRKTAALEALNEMNALAQGAVHRGDIKPMITWENSIHATSVWTQQLDSFDELKTLLRDVWETNTVEKNDNLLISGATFMPTETSTTTKGLDAFVFAQMIQLDLDDSELPPEEMQMILSDVKHLIYNSKNNGKNDLFRYRVLIPLSAVVTTEIYEDLWDILAARIADAGYTLGSDRVFGKKQSGMDFSKRVPTSFMYIPVQAKDKKHSFWIENWDNVPMMNPLEFAERILFEAPDYVEVAAVDNRSEKLKGLLNQINRNEKKTIAMTAETAERIKQHAYNNALVEWRATPAGRGNHEFFVFASKLRSAGYDLPEIRSLLNQHYAESASTSSERLVQIPSIIDTLSKNKESRRKVRY